MTRAREIPLIWRILVPLFACLAFMLAPRASGINSDLSASFSANELDQPAIAAAHQLSLAEWEPWRTGLREQSGLLALRGNNPELAILGLEQARQAGELSPAGWLALGQAYWDTSKNETAIQAWNGIMTQGAAPIEIYRRVYQYYRGNGKIDLASQTVQSWVRAYPQDGEALYTQGVLTLNVDPQAARQALGKAVEIDTGWASRTQILVQAIDRSGPDAPQEYRLVEIGRALGSLGEWDLALSAFFKAQTINPDYPEAWAFSSRAKQQLRQDGEPDLLRALALAPNSPVILALAAIQDTQKGDLEKALQRFQAASTLEPGRAIWLVEIGNTYADLHNTRKGLEYYQKAAAVEPENPLVWRWMAQYCLANELNVREVGLPAARQAVLLAPGDPAGLDMLGQVMLGLDDPTSAERFLQQALQKDPDFPAAHLHLGQLYLNLQNYDLAYYHLVWAVRMEERDAESSLLAKRWLARYFGGQ